MKIPFAYNANSHIDLEVPDDTLIADCGALMPGVTAADPAAAVLRAVEAPLEYPALADATVPGDCVAVVLDEDLPQQPAIVAGIVEALFRAGIEPGNLFVLQTQSSSRDPNCKDPLAELPLASKQAVELEVHDPGNRRRLAYLATSRADEAIYLNRVLCEADVVLPVGCLRPADAPGFRGMYGGLFPGFSDAETIDRVLSQRYSTHHVDSYANGARASKAIDRCQSDEVGWLLGARLMIQVVPGPQDGVLHVLCGDVDAVEARGRQLCDRVWCPSVSQRADLVVASITSSPSRQDWSSIARALHAAGQVVTSEGAIALCSDVACEPGESVRRLEGNEDPSELIELLADDRSVDARAARQIARALERGPLFLLSRLEEESVEQMGIAPLERPEQLSRLIHRFPSCILLPHAQLCMPQVAEERAC